jgi:unspecific monooxygenase
MARLLGVAAQELDATVARVHDLVQGIAPGASRDAIARADAACVVLMAQGESEGLSRVQAANRIALMQQARDATAGLIGNCIAALQRTPEQAIDTAWVTDVARRDPAVHNTRRFAARDLVLAGQPIAAGQGVLLVLVDEEGGLAFGHGAHACPGERIALGIATAALRALQSAGALRRFGPVRGYRPLPNARIPIFSKEDPSWSA